VEFCSEEEFLEVVINGDKKTFDEVLSRVFQKAVESAILYLPEAVDKLAKRNAYTVKAWGSFIDKHPEFKENKEIVISVIQGVEQENPLLTLEEVLEKAAPEIETSIKAMKQLKGV